MLTQGKRRLPERGPVALVRIEGQVGPAVERALALSQGLARLRQGDHVLVKPNLVGLPDREDIAPFGVLTTTAVVEAVLAALRAAGAGRIMLGDGGLVIADLGFDTTAAMARLGYADLARRYEVELVDLNQGPFVEQEIGGLKLKVASAALEADFLVNVPVLKTHNMTHVSLALKNTKGCLQLRSKAACHAAGGGLDRHVAELGLALYPDLVVVDGRYALARGPLHTGQASRADLVIAARDALDADCAGAAVIGFDPAAVEHLRLAAQALNRPAIAPEVTGGPTIAESRLDLPWDWPWADELTPEPYLRSGVRGFFLPKYNNTLCTGCSVMYNPALVLVLAAGTNKDLGGVELLTGKRAEPTGRAKTSILMGNCIIKHLKGDSRLGRTVMIAGCPPTLNDLISGLNQAGIPAEERAYERYMTSLAKRYTPEKGFLAQDFQPGGAA
jgi:uncharacterized protein (DUF362 family)